MGCGGGCGLGLGLDRAVALLCRFRPRPDVSMSLALCAADRVCVCSGAGGGGGGGSGFGVGGSLILSLSEPWPLFFCDGVSVSSASAMRSSLKVSSVWMMAALSFAAMARADGLLFRDLLWICGGAILGQVHSMPRDRK